MASQEEPIKTPSNSTRFPESLKAFVAWLMQQEKLIDKPASMMRECLQLGAQIRAAGLAPDGRDLYWEFTGAELARAIEGPVRQAVRFCERNGYSLSEIPPQFLEELERLRESERRLSGQLAHIEGLLVQLSQGGALLTLEAAAGSWNAHQNDHSGENRVFQSIETNEALAGRLGFGSGIAL